MGYVRDVKVVLLAKKTNKNYGPFLMRERALGVVNQYPQPTTLLPNLISSIPTNDDLVTLTGDEV